MRTILTVCAVAALLVFATGGAVAQETTGGIAGNVSDEVGTPVAGANISVEGAYGTVTAVSDDTGRYRFPRLTPGAYTVTASLEGFTESSAEVRVILGEVVTVDFAMQRASFEEEIVIYSDTVAIDFTESATTTSIREWEIDYLPRGRDFTDVVTFAAGAKLDHQAGGITIDGSSGLENRYVIDGIDTTDPQLGDSSVPMRADFMEEVQVKSAGYMAEFGGSTGGVINAVTRTGRNTWHGGLLLDVENEDWNGSARPMLRRSLETDEGELNFYSKDDKTRFDPGAFLGGPILRDSLWFFGSYQPGLTDTDRTVTFTDGFTDTYNQKETVDYATLNLTANIASSLLIKAGGSISPWDREGDLPNRDGRTSIHDQESYAPLGRKGERETYSLTADWIATDNFVVSGRAGFYHTNAEDVGIPITDIIHRYSSSSDPAYADAFPEIPSDIAQPIGFMTPEIINYAEQRNIYERTAGGIDASWYFRALGDHALKGGFQTEEISNDVLDGYNADYMLYYWNRSYTDSSGTPVRGTYGYFRLLLFATQGQVKTTNDALFIQDAWSVLPNLTLNIGLRAEKEAVPNYGAVGPDPAIEFDYSDKLAPRLGFAWDMFGNSTWKLYGSYGTYFDVTKYGMARGSFGGDKWVDYYFTFDNYDYSLNYADTCRTGSNTIFEQPECPAGTFIEALDRRHNSVDPDDPRIDPNLKPMESWEGILGTDWQVTPKIQVGARYVHKEIVRAIEDAGLLVPGVGEVFYIVNPGYGLSVDPEYFPYAVFPKAEREYDALELTFDRRFADNWSLRGYYRLSRLWGNYSGLANADEQNSFGDPYNPVGTSARRDPNTSRLFDNVAATYDANGNLVYGRLATDRPHQLGAQFLYSFDFGFSVGVNQYIASGTPISEIALTPPSVEFYPKGRGNMGDTPWIYQTDLSLWQTFNFNRIDFSIGLTVLNLFDSDTETRIYSHRTIDDLPLTEAEFFAGFNYDSLVETVDADGAFGMPDTFQPARELRLSFKLEF